jgi:hypothetical protein
MAAGAALTIGLAASLGACGSSSSSKSPAAKPPHATTAASAPSGGASVTTGPVRASFQGAGHNPVAKKAWAYSVHVTDAGGHPLSGTVKIQFAYGGQVVGTDHPPVHPVKDGSWHDNLTFPAESVGYPLTLQAVVHTKAGSVTLSWPITVHK